MNYKFSKREYFIYISIAVITIVIVSYLFYEDLRVALVLSPAIWFYLKYQKKRFKTKKQEELKLEFCNAIEALCAPIRAGYSLENAFKKIEMDISMIYGKDSVILSEIISINNKVDMNVNIEDAIKEFAQRSEIKEIEDFAEVVKVSKRANGDIVKVIGFTSKLIREAYDTKREIQTLVTGKKYEASIMKIMPLLILVYMKMCMKGYISVLYGNIGGVCLMSVLLIIYLVMVISIEKIATVKM